VAKQTETYCSYPSCLALAFTFTPYESLLICVETNQNTVCLLFVSICLAPFSRLGSSPPGLTHLRKKHSFDSNPSLDVPQPRPRQHVLQELCGLRSPCTVDPDRSCYSSCLRPSGRQVSTPISHNVNQISCSANSQPANTPSDVKSICVNGSTVEQTLVSDCGNDYDAAMSAFSSICAGVSVTIGKFNPRDYFRD